MTGSLPQKNKQNSSKQTSADQIFLMLKWWKQPVHISTINEYEFDTIISSIFYGNL